MNRKLTTLNSHLARAVLVAGGIFAVTIGALATMTGEMTLLAGTGFGIAAAGYGLIVTRKPLIQPIRIYSGRHANAA